jgi:hypothetical protein
MSVSSINSDIAITAPASTMLRGSQRGGNGGVFFLSAGGDPRVPGHSQREP